MKIDLKFWFIALCVAILIGVLLTIGFRIGKGSVKPPKPITTYITDTVYIDKPYVMPIAPKGFKYIVKPTIVGYQHPDMAIVGVLSRKNDSLQQVITNIKGKVDTVIISDNFLTLFPKSPKLLSLYLKYDSLWITLLNTKADVVTLHYPLDFPANAYWFSDNTFTSKPFPVPKKKVPLKPSMSVYTGIGLPIDGTIYPLLSLQYTQPIRPVQLQLEAQMTINNKPQYIIFAKAGFRIF
jgi:hypothetical protein